MEKHVLLKKLRDALEALRGRVTGKNKDDVEEAIAMVSFIGLTLVPGISPLSFFVAVLSGSHFWPGIGWTLHRVSCSILHLHMTHILNCIYLIGKTG